MSHVISVSKAQNLLPVRISHMRPEETGFVLGGWKNSFRFSPKNAARPKGQYFAQANKDVDAILARPNARVLVATDPADASFALGFIVFEVGQRFAVHFAYTRDGFRRLGVAKQLLQDAWTLAGRPDGGFYTHSTRFDDEAEERGFILFPLVEWLKQ